MLDQNAKGLCVPKVQKLWLCVGCMHSTQIALAIESNGDIMFEKIYITNTKIR